MSRPVPNADRGAAVTSDPNSRRQKMKRAPRDIGAVHDVYAGTRHTGAVKVTADGYQAMSEAAGKLGTFETEAEANKAIFEADKAGRVV